MRKYLDSISVIFSVWIVLTTIGISDGKTPSGLYRDDGKGHTILTQEFSQSDVNELSYEILSIMGFNHRPHPYVPSEDKNPGSQFLKEVYNSIVLTEDALDVDLSNGENGRRQNWRGRRKSHNLTWSEFNVNDEEVNAISQADSIISFPNRGKKID